MRGIGQRREQPALAIDAGDHSAASQPDGDGGPGSDVQRDSDRHGSIDVSMAEERSEHHGRELIELHNTCDNDFRERLDV